MADFPNAVQAQTFSLSGAGAIAGATSVVLKSFKQIDGTTNIVMTDFGSIGYGTIEPGNSTLEEQISFTGVTQNANGTATLTGVKTVLFTTPYTETAGLSKTHGGSTVFVISNDSGFYNAIKGYVDAAIVTGSVPATDTNPGISILATAAQINAGTATEIFNAVTYPLEVTPDQLLISNYGVRLPTVNEKTSLTALAQAILPYAADAQASDTYVITLSPAPTAYTAGMTISFKANTANTGAATLNVNSLGAKTIVKNYNVTLANNDIKANQIIEVVYDGTNFQMISPISNGTIITSGATSKDCSSTTTTTFAHGLGIVPQMVKIDAKGSTGAGIFNSGTTYIGSTQSSNYNYGNTGSGTVEGSGNTFRMSNDNGTDALVGSVTVDATNVNITWATVGGGTFTGTAFLLWEAYS